jgi:UDP-N-acetylmuramate dehydrogenase
VPSSLSPELNIQQNVLLAPLTTFGIGGPARYFCRVTTEAELLLAVSFAEESNLTLFTLGGGSNLLVPDAGFNGLVIQIGLEGQISSNLVGQSTRVRFQVPAGHGWDYFVQLSCEGQGHTGIECLAGIPGTVGGTPVQNVGAYGQEVSQTIHSVRVLDLETHAFEDLTAEECDFSYRSSIFNTTHRGRYIVTRVEFDFDLDAAPNLTYADLKTHFANAATPPRPIDIYHAVRDIRHRKGMLLVEGEQDCRSAGSFFKNPIVPVSTLTQIAAALGLNAATIPNWPASDGQIKLPAAWLLERAGFHKGFTLGEAGISSRHTLALINRGHATAADITALRDRIQQEVQTKFSIHLEQEPIQLSS